MPSRGNLKYTRVQSLCVVVLLRECEQNTREKEGHEQDSQGRVKGVGLLQETRNKKKGFD